MSVDAQNTFDSDTYIIEIGDVAAGIALRERGGYSFVASDRPFRVLDGSRFRRVQQIESAARSVLQASAR